MGVVEFFKPVASLGAEDLRALLARRHHDDVQIVDVRHGSEFEKGHLPGAFSIPLADLPEQTEHLDRSKTTIICCRLGLRSRAAAALLQGAGFEEVQVLETGIDAWDGHLAKGRLQPEQFPYNKVDSLKEFLALAWYMEDATCDFYRHVAGKLPPSRMKQLFERLVLDEQNHKKTLVELSEVFLTAEERKNFPYSIVPEFPGPRMLEGGYNLNKAKQWAESGELEDLVELALGVEANAFDRYQTLRHRVADENVRRLLEIIASDEKRHLHSLAQTWERFDNS